MVADDRRGQARARRRQRRGHSASATSPSVTMGGNFGWGGGVAVADMDHDGFPEIAYGRTLFSTTNNAITRMWVGAGGHRRRRPAASSATWSTSTDNGVSRPAGRQHRLRHRRATSSGKTTALPDGFTAVGDMDQDGTRRHRAGQGRRLDPRCRHRPGHQAGPVDIPLEDTRGGPPTIADFDGDGAAGDRHRRRQRLRGLRGTTSRSTVAARDQGHLERGDRVLGVRLRGRRLQAEVVYSDECFLRVLDGLTGEPCASPRPTPPSPRPRP